jgi:hypothetical protein
MPQDTQDRDVCAGGNVSIDESSFTFVNHHTVVCNVTFATTPPGANSSYSVPAKSGSTPGTTVVGYTSGITGTYGYTASCCDKDETNPNIKVQ